jgi:elongator complex protein 2
MTDHAGSVNCIAVLDGVLATGSSDGTVSVYSSDVSLHFTLVQSLRTSPLYPLTLALHKSPDGYLLAIGGSSPHIHIYTSPLTNLSFTNATILKGHEDWIRGLDFTSTDNDITLASASQDRYVRLWRISPPSSSSSSSTTTTINPNDTDALYHPFHPLSPTFILLTQIHSLTEALGGESYPFTLNNKTYNIIFSALLPGHDDWVFTVKFHPTNPNQLLSASADASLIIWRPEEDNGIWIPETRLGDVSSLKGATTAQGSSGGFWGGVWSPRRDEVACWGKTGGWRVWIDSGDSIWQQKSAISGAIRSVKGISWDPLGRYLLSTRYITLSPY